MRSKRLARKKWFKRLGFFLVLLLIFFIATLFINLYFSPIVSRQLKKTVAQTSGGLYQVDFASVRLHIISGRIVVNHLRLKADNAVFSRLKTAGKAPNTLYNLSVDQIVLYHFHPFKLYFNRELDIDKIEISQPYIQAVYHQQKNSNLTEQAETKTLYQQISGVLKSVHIGKIIFSNISLRYREETDQQIRIRHLKDIQLTATDFLVDKNSINNKNRFSFCKDITAVFNNFQGSTSDNLYQYAARALVFSSSKSNIILKNAVFSPKKTVGSLAAEKLNPPRAKLHLETDSIHILGFDYRSFISNRNFIAADVTIFAGKADVYFKHIVPQPAAAVQKVGLYFMLKNIRHDINIKTLNLQHIDLAYSEVSPKTNLFGTITFEQLSGKISNIITGKDTVGANRNITANLSANLMGYGKLDANIHFNAADSTGLLYYKGTLGSMNLANLNPASKPLALIQFTTGFINELSFNMQADAEKATGKVLFLYHDLNVILLRKDEKNALKRMGFVSILANAMILIRDNPTFNQPPRMVNVVYNRQENASFTGMIWRSIFAGIKESIGFSAEVEQTIRQKITDQKQNKEARKQKKAERQKRRKIRRMKRYLKEAQDY